MEDFGRSEVTGRDERKNADLTVSVPFPHTRWNTGEPGAASVAIMCSRTGEFVSTGIEMDEEAFAALPVRLSRMRCPACGSNHVWSRATAWLSGFGRLLRTGRRRALQRPSLPIRSICFAG